MCARMLRVNAGHLAPAGLPLLLSSPRAPVSISASVAQDAGACALLVGTAIGGGFLALPYATAPAGALPSAAVLTGCWAWLLAESLLIAELVMEASAERSRAGNSSAPVSFASLGYDAFGEAGGGAVSLTFIILMITTMVSQIAKGDALLASVPMAPASAAVRCGVLAASVSTFARLASANMVSLINGALTVGFIGAVSTLFAAGWPLADWSRLARADWSLAFQAAPTLLQLHVYCEVVPVVCSFLSYSRARVRRVIVVGSLALLAIQLFWSSLGIALVAPSLGGGALRADPVASLMLGHGYVTVTSRLRHGYVAAATAATATTAVLTTILGTARALHIFSLDATRASKTAGVPSSSPSAGVGGRAGGGGLPSLLLYAATIAIPTTIATTAGSTAAYFGAIDLAGAYPAALLWGLVPPLMAMRRRRTTGAPRSPGLVALATLSAAFVAANLAGDIAWLLPGLGGGINGGRARWQ